MKAKYIEERFPSCPHEETVTREEYLELREFVVDCCLAFDEADTEAFRRFYYGGKY